MSLVVWDSGTESIEILRSQLPASSVNLVTQDIDELLSFVQEQGKVTVVFDFAGDKKIANKHSKKLMKLGDELQILFLCDGLKEKEIIKHQKSKAAVHGYLTNPIRTAIIQELMGIEGAQDSQAVDEVKPLANESLSSSIQDSFDAAASGESASSMFDNADDLSLDSSEDLDLGQEQDLESGAEVDLGDDLSLDADDSLDLGGDDLGLDSSEELDGLDLGADDLVLDESLDGGEDFSLDGDDDLSLDDMSADISFEESLESTVEEFEDNSTEMNEEILEAMNEMDGEDLSLFSQKLEEFGLLKDFDPSANENYGLIKASFEQVFDNNEKIFEHIDKIHKEKTMSDDELTLDTSDDLSLELGDESDASSQVNLDDGGLDLSLDSSEGELELGDSSGDELNLEADDGGLDLNLDSASEEGLELSDGSEPEVSLDTDDGGLDLSLDSADSDELSLGADQEVATDSEDVSLDLDSVAGSDLGEELDFTSSADDAIESSEAPVEVMPDEDLIIDEEAVDLDFAAADDSGMSQEKTGLEDLGFNFADDSILPDESPDIDTSIQEQPLDQGLELSNEVEELAEFKPEAEASNEVVEDGGYNDKMAEIDAMMADDIPSPMAATEDKTGDITLPDGLEDTKASEINLEEISQAQISTGQHEAQGLQEAPYNTNKTSTHVRNQMAEIDQLMDGASEPASPSTAGASEITQVNMQVPQSSVNLNDLKSQNQIVQFHNEELAKLAATINALREEREFLISKIETLEENSMEEKRNSNAVKAELDEKKIELSLVKKRFNQQFEESQYRVNLEQEKKRIYEEKNRAIQNELNKLQQKVKVDVKKIQHREKELESQLELLRADSEIQLKNRDEKILDLKRKIDSLEFEVDTLSAQEKQSKEENVEVEERMEMVMKTLRSAITILEEDEVDLRSFKNIKKNLDV